MKEDFEAYCRSRLMLFKPWRDEDKDLLGKHATYADAYTAEQATYKAR
jgi:hypothetical protein